MIGIDGGGTKTEFALFAPRGEVLKSFRLPGSNAALAGLDGTLGILMQGIDACLNEYPNVCGIFAGLAGPKLDAIGAKLSEKYPEINIAVNSDGVNAFRSAEGDFALICGTGSILITRSESGYRRIGGWGARIGDPGSAYNFARDALRCAFAYEDGIAKRTPIYDKLLKKTKAADCQIRNTVTLSDVPYIASLSTVVFDAYREGSSDAAEIIDTEMKDLADLINKAFPSGGRCVTCGGVMEHNGDILLPILKKYLKSYVTFIFPALPPIYGACVACTEVLCIAKKDGFESTFHDSYLRNKMS